MATFSEESLKKRINEIKEMKTKDLKSLLTAMKLPKSRKGVSNKLVLRTILLDDWLKEFDLDHYDISRDYHELYVSLF